MMGATVDMKGQLFLQDASAIGSLATELVCEPNRLEAWRFGLVAGVIP